ncbi:MAG: hypothetical protein K0B01_01675 [Syntrophobacterales bacterium]|nr:hypothetical protein [Syntrophobacterales bacterium]
MLSENIPRGYKDLVLSLASFFLACIFLSAPVFAGVNAFEVVAFLAIPPEIANYH